MNQALLKILLAALVSLYLGSEVKSQPAATGATSPPATPQALDPAQIKRQIERERERKLQESTQGLNKTPLFDESSNERPSQSLDESSLRIKTWELRGVELLPIEQLQALLNPYRERDISLAQLQALARLIELAYRDAGFLARAVIPAQDITQGVIRIEIVEAKLGDVVIESINDPGLAQKLRALLLAHQPLNAALRLDALERALSLINELPGVSVIGALSPGYEHQQTLLTLRAAHPDESAHDLELGLDNFGARATGRFRQSLLWAWNRPLSWGDQLQLQGLRTQGMHYQRLAYSLPLSLNGLRATAFTNRLDYDVQQGDFTALRPQGESTSQGFELRQALLRKPSFRLDATAQVESKSFTQRVDGLGQSARKLDSRQLALESQFADQALSFSSASAESTAFNTLQLMWLKSAVGSTSFNDDPTSDPTSHALSDQNDKRFFRWSYTRAQPLLAASATRPDTRLLIHVSGQRSRYTLDNAEKFYLGGASGIRAFPASEGFGSNGYLINSELRMQWSPRFTVGFLRDLGAVWEADTAHARYQGYGIQWSWRFLSGPSLPNTQLRFTIARRDRANPLPNPLTGTDRDGSLERTRLWLSLNGALR